MPNPNPTLWADIVQHTRTGIDALADANPVNLATAAMIALIPIVYAEYRRRTRTTPTLRARAATAILRATRNTTPTQRADWAELALVGWFVAVIAGLIMQGLVDFARTDMGLGGPWPYLFFFALDGMAALFAVASYRWAKAGASPLFPRLMVTAIMAGSSWFQWENHAALETPARVAWAALPGIGAVLWEFVLVQRRKAWKAAQPRPTGRVPRARWLWDPIGSAMMTRRMRLWRVTDWETALELHMVRVEAIRQLRRAYGLFWAWRVPADVAVRLKKGFRVVEAASQVDGLVAAARGELAPLGVEEVFALLDAPVVSPGTVVSPVSLRVPVDVLPPVALSAAPVPVSSPVWDPEPVPAPSSDAAPAPRPETVPAQYRTMRDLTPADYDKAVQEYRFSVMAGNPLTGRELCRRYRLNPDNRNFPRKIIRLAAATPLEQPHLPID